MEKSLILDQKFITDTDSYRLKINFWPYDVWVNPLIYFKKNYRNNLGKICLRNKINPQDRNFCKYQQKLIFTNACANLIKN